jgi:hypothetical protein
MEGFNPRNDLPEIQWRNQGETGGVSMKEGKALPSKTGETKANREGGGIMENEMPSLLLDEKYALYGYIQIHCKNIGRSLRTSKVLPKSCAFQIWSVF